MKILFISDNFYPESNAPAKRTYEHAIEWLKLSHNVTVITGNPNFPKGKIFEGYKNKLFQTEYKDDITIKRVWTFIASNKGFLLRIIDYMSFMFTSFISALFVKKHDIVIATSPQFFTAISGWMISVFKRIPFVLEIRDLWPESIVAVGAMKENNFFIKLLHKLACFLYKRADVIVCVTNSFKKELIALSIDDSKIVVIENGMNTDKLIAPNQSIDQIMKKYEFNNNDFIISFIGTIGMAHGLDVVVNAAKKIKDKNIKFLIIGEGAEKEKIIQRVKNETIDNVSILDSISWQEIININQVVSINLIHLKKNDLFKKVIPSKIFESMVMKKPIILGVDGESREILKNANCGFFMTPEDENSLIENIDKLQSDKDLLNSMGKNGYNFVINRYNRSKLAKKMIEFISNKVIK